MRPNWWKDYLASYPIGGRYRTEVEIATGDVRRFLDRYPLDEAISLGVALGQSSRASDAPYQAVRDAVANSFALEIMTLEALDEAA